MPFSQNEFIGNKMAALTIVI